MKNIEAFNVVCAYVLGKLFQEFPKPITINYRKLESEITELDPVFRTSPTDSPNFCGDVVIFLLDEGYIRALKTYAEGISEVRLTSKAFGILNRYPESLQSKKSLGEQFVDLKSAVTKESIPLLVKAFFAFGGLPG